MPITLEQMKVGKKRIPEQFRKDQLDMMAFSIALFNASKALKLGDADEQRIGKKLEEYSDALEKLNLDPDDPANEERIDQALDKLSTFGDFLGGAEEKYSRNNVFHRIRYSPGVKDVDKLETGLRAFNRFCGFGLNVASLLDGDVDDPTPQEQTARKKKLDDWQAKRQAERDARLEKQRRVAAARLQKQQAQQEELRREKERIEAAEKRAQLRKAAAEEGAGKAGRPACAAGRTARAEGTERL